ncbi:MAG TPA: MoaD/ThiS family protein [Polyangiaceae bacterium]
MTLRILYFAGLRDAVGLAEETVELEALRATHASGTSGHAQDAAPTVRELADHLAARHPAYRERRGHVRIARNEAFAGDDEHLVDGDVVALIPPVAGG